MWFEGGRWVAGTLHEYMKDAGSPKILTDKVGKRVM